MRAKLSGVSACAIAGGTASRTSALLAQHRPAAVALTNGYHLAFWIACGLVVTAAAVAATVLRSQPALAQSPEPVPALKAAATTAATAVHPVVAPAPPAENDRPDADNGATLARRDRGAERGSRSH